MLNWLQVRAWGAWPVALVLLLAAINPMLAGCARAAHAATIPVVMGEEVDIPAEEEVVLDQPFVTVPGDTSFQGVRISVTAPRIALRDLKAGQQFSTRPGRLAIDIEGAEQVAIRPRAVSAGRPLDNVFSRLYLVVKGESVFARIDLLQGREDPILLPEGSHELLMVVVGEVGYGDLPWFGGTYSWGVQMWVSPPTLDLVTAPSRFVLEGVVDEAESGGAGVSLDAWVDPVVVQPGGEFTLTIENREWTYVSIQPEQPLEYITTRGLLLRRGQVVGNVVEELDPGRHEFRFRALWPGLLRITVFGYDLKGDRKEQVWVWVKPQ